MRSRTGNLGLQLLLLLLLLLPVQQLPVLLQVAESRNLQHSRQQPPALTTDLLHRSALWRSKQLRSPLGPNAVVLVGLLCHLHALQVTYQLLRAHHCSSLVLCLEACSTCSSSQSHLSSGQHLCPLSRYCCCQVG